MPMFYGYDRLLGALREREEKARIKNEMFLESIGLEPDDVQRGEMPLTPGSFGHPWILRAIRTNPGGVARLGPKKGDYFLKKAWADEGQYSTNFLKNLYENVASPKAAVDFFPISDAIRGTRNARFMDALRKVSAKSSFTSDQLTDARVLERLSRMQRFARKKLQTNTGAGAIEDIERLLNSSTGAFGESSAGVSRRIQAIIGLLKTLGRSGE